MFIKRIVAAGIGSAVMFAALPAVAAYGEYPSVAVQCNEKTGSEAVVTFWTNQSAAHWSVISEDGSDVPALGETDSVPVDKSLAFRQAIAVNPGTVYTFGVTTADLGERLEYSWEWVNTQSATVSFVCEPVAVPDTPNPVIEDAFYEPTGGMVTALGFIRDVYRRALTVGIA